MIKILGINIGHDSGASLLVDSTAVACVNEERLSRIKMHQGFPFLSISEVLNIAKIDYSEIDVICIEGKEMLPIDYVSFEAKGDLKKYFASIFKLEKFLLGTKLGLVICKYLLMPATYQKRKFIESFFKSKGFMGEFFYADHHHCHAATAYYTQPMNKGLAITLDASGEGWCSRIYACDNDKMTLLHSIPCYFSPAYYYAHVTKLLGFSPLKHEGKITGLAAYGNPKKTLEIFEKFITFDSKKMIFANNGGYHLEAFNKLRDALHEYSKEDIAAGIQAHTEQLVEKYITAAIKKFNNSAKANIFLSGGLFANVKVNQRVKSMPNVNSLYIFPNMGDGGLGTGAALAYLNKRIDLSSLYLGKEHNDVNIEFLLGKYNLNYKISENIAKDTALEISRNKVIARYSGRMEFGPRALGNRSILYAAKDRATNQWLNEKLNRTDFMPFAPVVRDVDASKYFEIGQEEISLYKDMTIACFASKHSIKHAQATTHIDNTARPQIITRAQNPTYYDILSEYNKITGEGILVNTSFNLHEEPIINTPEEAILTFIKSGIDFLSLENYLIENKHGSI